MTLLSLSQGVYGHLSLWHPSMWGFNVTDKTFNYDNRPVVPLADMTFDQWWFHNFLDYPPHSEDVLEFEAGKTTTVEISCAKSGTSFFASDPGHTDLRQPDGFSCPGGNNDSIHTNSTGILDVPGSALAIADSDNPHTVQPGDFTVFSVNYSTPYTSLANFDVPRDMPKCSGKHCICLWGWIHSPNSGSMQMYLTFFQCAITNVQPTAKKIGKPQPPRRCGVDHISGRTADPKNCTIGAKQPLYWYQKERNNVAGDTYDPPYYNGYLGWADGAQNDIFVDGSGNPVNGDPSQSKDQPHPPPAPPAQQQGQGQPQKQEQKTDQQKTVAVGTGLKGSTKKKCPAGKRKKQNHRNRRHKVKSRDVVIS